jgi:hypothetical protein
MKARVLLIVVAALLGLAACGSKAGASAYLEPANVPGADPFTSSVAIGPAVGFPANVDAITTASRKTFAADTRTHVLVAQGTAPGLYGGSGDEHVCNKQQLVEFLQQNPAKAAAWAEVLGIATGDIAKFISGLTPVVLTNDTLVTNHGYANGHATTLTSVLEAGTAVMVDNTGTPRVKCNCGNPLTPSQPISVAHTTGQRWAGYDPAQVTIIRGGPPVEQLTLIDIRSGDAYTEPVGDASSHSTTPTTRLSPTTTPPPPTTTTPPAGASITNVDFRNFDYMDQSCGSNKLVHLTNGQYQGVDQAGAEGLLPGQTTDCGMTITDVFFADVTGDGLSDAIVTGTAADENAKGWRWTTVFTGSGSGPLNLGYLPGGTVAPFSAAGGIAIWAPAPQETDPLCCPSTFAKDVYVYDGGKFNRIGHTVVPKSQAPSTIANGG